MQELQETQVQALGWEDPLEEGMATPLQYSGLENPVGRGAWWARVHGVAKSWTRLRRLSTARTMSGEEGVWPCVGNGAMREGVQVQVSCPTSFHVEFLGLSYHTAETRMRWCHLEKGRNLGQTLSFATLPRSELCYCKWFFNAHLIIF